MHECQLEDDSVASHYRNSSSVSSKWRIQGKGKSQRQAEVKGEKSTKLSSPLFLSIQYGHTTENFQWL